jgi:CheY-like chemotaxis protein
MPESNVLQRAESMPTRTCVILMADDDQEDCLLAREALEEAGVQHPIRFVRDGEELLAYLGREGEFQQAAAAPRPDLILLDLAMPKKGGREALRELKSSARWQRIPVVVLTTSTSPDDIDLAYFLGANSYVTKPATYRGWVDFMASLTKYWFEIVELPPAD